MRQFFEAFAYFIESGLPEKLAKEFAEKYRPQVEVMVSMGLTYNAIANKMRELELKTSRGFYYTPASVRTLIIKHLNIDKENVVS